MQAVQSHVVCPYLGVALLYSHIYLLVGPLMYRVIHASIVRFPGLPLRMSGTRTTHPREDLVASLSGQVVKRCPRQKAWERGPHLMAIVSGDVKRCPQRKVREQDVFCLLGPFLSLLVVVSAIKRQDLTMTISVANSRFMCVDHF